MDNEFKDFTATPTLTFDVAPETKEAPAATAASDLADRFRSGIQRKQSDTGRLTDGQ